jgi:hypothetical protein
MMELSYFINLIFIFGLNVLFFFSGICLNSVVILSVRRSVQLRKKSVDVLISYEVFSPICFCILFGPMLFINYKLFRIARKSRRNNRIPPDMKKSFPLKNISSCLLAVACFVVLYIPVFVYIGLTITSKGASTFDGYIAALWAKTITSMNSTCNCLIFYWKNKILRTEGMKILKKLKLRGSL